MSAIYKLLDNQSNNKTNIDPNTAGAPHLVFAQTMASRVAGNKQLKSHKCGLPNYTIYTCPNCNNKNIFNNGRP